MMRLAILLQHGVGFDKPRTQLAARLYTRSVAEHSNLVAAYHLAIMYATGSGVEQDPLLAQQLLEYVISAGDDKAMYDLGVLHTQKGPQQDLPAAVMWATLAIRHNPASAGTRLLQALDPIATPEQITQGITDANAWRRVPKGISIVTIGGDENEFANLNLTVIS